MLKIKESYESDKRKIQFFLTARKSPMDRQITIGYLDYVMTENTVLFEIGA